MHALIGNCRHCGYSLVRLTEPRCPECGKAFDPEDPRTMYLHDSRLAEFLARGTSVWTVLPALVACVAAIGCRALFPEAPWIFIPATVAAILTAGTLYICMARSNFRRYIRKLQREAGRGK